MSEQDKRAARSAMMGILAELQVALPGSIANAVRERTGLAFSATTIARFMKDAGWSRPEDSSYYRSPPDWPRRSGRTWRILETVPDGGFFFVVHQAEQRHAERLLVEQGRRHDAVTIVSLSTSMKISERLRGTPRGTIYQVDHDGLRAPPEALDDLYRFVVARGWERASTATPNKG